MHAPSLTFHPDTNYVIVYQTETDGDILLAIRKGRSEVDSFEKHLKKRGLTHYDYAIIEGKVVKSFHQV